MYRSSRFSIKDLAVRENFIPNEFIQSLPDYEVDFPAVKETRHLIFNPAQTEQTNRFGQFHKHIHIAVGPQFTVNR